MKNEKIKMYGAMWCPDTLRAIAFFDSREINYEYHDIDEGEDNVKFVEQINNGLRVIPTIIFPDGTILSEPTNTELQKAIEKLHLD